MITPTKMKLLAFLAITLSFTISSMATLVTVSGQFAVTSSTSSSVVAVGDIFSFTLNYEDSLLDLEAGVQFPLNPFNATGEFISSSLSNLNLTVTKVSGTGTFSGSISSTSNSSIGPLGQPGIFTNGLSDITILPGNSGQLIDPLVQATYLRLDYNGPFVINDTGTGQTLANQLGNQSIGDITWTTGSVTIGLNTQTNSGGSFGGTILNVPEPTTLSGLAMGLFSILRRRRRS
jgi:hypothetical protein